MPYVTARDGTRLAYRTVGTGPPLLCLAGGPGEDVRELGTLGGLDAARTLVLTDARAGGASGVPEDRASCAFPAQAGDLEELRAHLGAERIDVLAHSAGALTAQHYAAVHPARVRRLVLVTPAGRADREVDRDEVAALRARRAAEPWYPAAAEAARQAAAGVMDETVERRLAPFRYGHWNATTEAHSEAPRVRAPDWLFDAFYGGAPAPGEAGDRLRLLRSAPAPVLVVAGGRDCVAGTRPAALVAALYRHGRLRTLPGAGHYPWLDAPGPFRRLVADFLAEGPGREPEPPDPARAADAGAD